MIDKIQFHQETEDGKCLAVIKRLYGAGVYECLGAIGDEFSTVHHVTADVEYVSSLPVVETEFVAENHKELLDVCDLLYKEML